MPLAENGIIYTPKYVKQQTGQVLRGLFSNYQILLTFAADFLRASPFYFPQRCRLDQIGVRIQVAGGAGAKIRIGVYDDTGNLYPRNLLVDAGEIDATIVGTDVLNTTVYCNPGVIYWLVTNNNDGTIQIFIPENIRSLCLIEDTDVTGYIGYRVAQAYGALPTAFPAGAAKHYEAPNVYYRIAGWL